MLYCFVSAWLRKGSWPFRMLQIFQAELLLFVCVCSSKAAIGTALETIGGCEAILYIALEPVGSSQILQSVTCLLLRVLRHICLDNALFVQTVQAAHLEPLHQHLSAAAVGRGAAHWGAWGARTVRATAAAAVGPGWGGGGRKSPTFFLNTKRTGNGRKPPRPRFDLNCSNDFCLFYKNTWNDSRVDMHILVVGSRKNKGNMTSSGKEVCFSKMIDHTRRLNFWKSS